MRPSSSTLRSFRLLYLLPFLCHEVAANTEIINFSSSRERAVDLPLDVVGNWSKLRPSENEREWTLEPAVLHTPLHQVCEGESAGVPPHPPFSCPHELWLLLDLDDDEWGSYSAFTLRLSWPASVPAAFTIRMYTPQGLLARLSSSERDRATTAPPFARERETDGRAFRHTGHAPTTRSRYARIRAVDAGVPTPGFRSHPHPQRSLGLPRGPIFVATPHSASDDGGLGHSVIDERQGRKSVPFIVIVEPLYLGVLPATLLPTVGFLVLIALAAAWFARHTVAYLEPFIQQAREDLKTRMIRTNKEA